jgi:hypothetical protein
MKKKLNVVLAALSLALLMVFSINVFSQGNKPQQEDKGKAQASSCMAMMENKEMMSMCGKMMSNMKSGSSMCGMQMDGDMKMDGDMQMDGKKGEDKVKPAEPKGKRI